MPMAMQTRVWLTAILASWMHGRPDQKEFLWAMSAVMEAQTQALMATGEMPMNLTEVRDRFAQAPYRVC